MEVKEGGGGFVRADQIDLKRLDEQLEKHLTRAWSLDKSINKDESTAAAESAPQQQRQRQQQQALAVNQHLQLTGNGARHEWEIDPSKLVIKSVIARGTFGTVHRGFYDGLDVAGQFNSSSLSFNCLKLQFFSVC